MTVTTELLTISVLKEEGFKSNLKSKEGVSLPYLDLELVPQQGILRAQCSTSHPTFRHFWNHT